MAHRTQGASDCGREAQGWNGEREPHGERWVIVEAFVWVVVLQVPITSLQITN